MYLGSTKSIHPTLEEQTCSYTQPVPWHRTHNRKISLTCAELLVMTLRRPVGDKPGMASSVRPQL